MSDSATIVFRRGTVVDGTGAPGELRDLVVIDGRVADTTEVPADAIELDATGCIVAPGFIDIHTHYDAQVFWDPALTPSSFHGVTTVVAGNCGFSIAPTRPDHREVIAKTLENVEDMDVASLAEGIPWDFETFAEYLGSVERRGTDLNFAAYVGHTPLRLYVMGTDAYHRAATIDEISEMRRVLRAALEAGAVGFATSFAPTHRGMDGMPIPSRVASKDEVLALLEEIKDWGRGVVGITPGGGWTIDELYELQPKIGVPITYTALLSSPGGEHRKRIQTHQAGVLAGANVWPQVSPRPLTFSFQMNDPFPLNACDAFGALMTASPAQRQAAYADADFVARAEQAIDRMTALRPRFDTYELAGTAEQPSVDGQSLTELAARQGLSPLATLLAVAAENTDLWVRAIAANDDADEVATILSTEHCALGLSDAGAHAGLLCDAPQATDFLGRWVRDRALMPIEEAVRRLTSAQADLFGLEGRGRLTPGSAADVVVFDPATIDPGPITRVRDFPANAERLTAASPTGVRHVLVNGVPIRRDGVQLDCSAHRPGQIVTSS